METDIFFKNASEYLGFEFDDAQRRAIIGDVGPQWIIAGPGSGKTAVLSFRVLKLIFVDGVSPDSIVVTTFTEKAARSLENKILSAFEFFKTCIGAKDIDISSVKIGTLHSISENILSMVNYNRWREFKLMNDIERMIYAHKTFGEDIRKASDIWDDPEFRELLPYGGKYVDKWSAVKVVMTAIDYITENLIDIQDLKNSKRRSFVALAEIYDAYVIKLDEDCRCDFSILEKKMADMLNDAEYAEKIENNLMCEYVLVDEYQDTNPIQEKIYFLLSNKTTNLNVVGDDDQALYRFRGGTVDCMVFFREKCIEKWNIEPKSIFLNKNYRSGKGIVEWLNSYISSFELLKISGARTPRGTELISCLEEKYDYPEVSLIETKSGIESGEAFADLVEGLFQNNIIDDYNKCALLLPSVKDSIRGSGHFLRALEKKNIGYYNPRSKSFCEKDEVKACFGAFLSIVDRDFKGYGKNIDSKYYDWVSFYSLEIAPNNIDLKEYVDNSYAYLASTNKKTKRPIQSIFFRIMSYEPFKSWRNDPERDMRLSIITRLMESYCSIHNRSIKIDTSTGGVSSFWLSEFYYSLVGYLSIYGIDEDEDEEFIFPHGKVPILTIHQSKGLEFPFVVVSGLNQKAETKGGGIPDVLSHLRNKKNNFTPLEQRMMDLIRQYYVAYSRGECATILIGTSSQIKESKIATGGNGYGWFNAEVQRLIG